ncbi:hypothetical protein OG609_38630 [Streptomyces sp. NBC_01224]|uniref:hypothetical protein n=1 Tax=Streptomyces sp. NBC_01224 TaxID=2903783 RepID=UPI002E133A04|nr:hypothetical protein OG609_38630 [Streptomyces sp. NBC_01224]
MNTAKAATDKDKRARELMKAVQTAGADLPYLPLGWAQTATVLSKEIVLLDQGPFAFIGPWATAPCRRRLHVRRPVRPCGRCVPHRTGRAAGTAIRCRDRGIRRGFARYAAAVRLCADLRDR